MSKSYDLIVVGAGQNALTAAAYLSKAGLKVLVLEKNGQVGGGVVSKAVTAPGFMHDTHATTMVLVMANPMIASDELGLLSKFGLSFADTGDAPFHATAFDDGTALFTYTDLDKTCQAIAEVSPVDAEAHRSLVQRMMPMSELFLSGTFKPPLPFGQFISLLEQSREGRELVSAMLKSSYDVICEIYTHEKVRLHFLKWASELMIGPEEKGTGVTPYFLAAIQHRKKAGIVVGGSQSLADSLKRCIEHYGGEVRTNALVTEYIVSNGRCTGVKLEDGETLSASRAVIGGIHPHDLGKFLPGLDPYLIDQGRKVQLSQFGAVNTHWALNEAPKYKADARCNTAVCTEVVPADMARFRKTFDNMRYGRMPDDFNAVIQVHTNHDPSRAPAGKHTLYLYTFAPLLLADGGLAGWERKRDEVKEWVITEYSKYCTNMDESNIIAGYAETPLDMQNWNPNFRNGDIFGVGSYIHQWSGRRPFSEIAQYAVPGIGGLYLSGPFQHPGGAVTGGGRATAIKVMQDLGIKLAGIAAV
ncbi:phytoene dehydrogenase-like protein [Paraburkholderia unamae]|uniref:phytoene desaturase family protein n=1 Tax=Paraburkholderia unamae TaxID=219649 RepID=UPI000DC4BB65|nr:NAD(P)/FAD-dependent oxidoreductase [Paraburkholderia unamae]RAR57893.1 phytoene dehydrogenase-like protein [Paraburkholderia unamae]